MRSMKSIGFVFLTTSLLAALMVPQSRADEWDKKTRVTCNEAVQVPGVTLPGGTYVFKLADSDNQRTIVEIFNEDETRLITTILAIPDYHIQTPGKTIISFDERPKGQPEALKAWFYPGDNFGVAFVYPKPKAAELARANQQPVLSIREEVTDTATLKLAIVEPVPPLPEDQPRVVEAVNAQQPAADSTPGESAQAAELPQTASPMPSIALGGLLLLAGAFAVRRLSPGCK